MKALAVTTLLVLSSVVFVVPQASANHDPLESDLLSCTLSLTPPVMTGTTSATATATYACPTPRQRITVAIGIDVFTLSDGYRTVASSTSSSGPTAVLTEEVSAAVCLSGATQMRARATGYWMDSHGGQRGTRFGESLPVPLTCSIR